MLDPVSAIGLAGSIAGLIEFVKPLIKQIGPSKHDKAELTQLVATLVSLQRTYALLEEFLEQNDGYQAAMRDNLVAPIKQCVEAISILRARLELSNSVKKFALGKGWDGKLDKCKKVLDDTRSLFDWAMQIDQ